MKQEIKRSGATPRPKGYRFAYRRKTLKDSPMVAQGNALKDSLRSRTKTKEIEEFLEKHRAEIESKNYSFCWSTDGLNIGGVLR